MVKKAEFLMCIGDQRVDKAYFLEYQKAILFALEKEGLLDQGQLAECLERLEKQCL